MNLKSKIILYIYYDRYRIWVILIFLIILFILLNIYGPYISTLLPWLSAITKDPVLATLIAAAFGGAIAFYGSIYVQRYQVKSEAAIRRRDDIFIPLYNELVALKQKLRENPHPYQIVFSEIEGYHNDPKFLIWREFMNDSRKLQVPIDLANSLNKFISVVKHYNRARSKALDDKNVEKVIREIVIANSVQNYSQFKNFTHHLLPSNNDLSKTEQMLNSFTSKIEENKEVRIKTNMEIDAIAQEIFIRCSEIASVRKMQEYRSRIDCKCDELINALALIIKYINEKFEHNAKWF